MMDERENDRNDRRGRLARASERRGATDGAFDCGQWESRHGIHRVALFPGALGYVDVRRFESGAAARTTAITALRLLADATTLVIDLRHHTGGGEEMASLLTSLLFDTEPLYGECVYTGTAKLFAGTSIEPRFATQRVELLVGAATSDEARAFARNLVLLGRA